MTTTTKTEVKYEALLLRGLNECDLAGNILEDGPDEPFVVMLNRVTTTRVFDKRGERHSDKTRDVETLGEIPIAEAAKFAASIVESITYAYEVAERRVLTTNKKENNG